MSSFFCKNIYSPAQINKPLVWWCVCWSQSKHIHKAASATSVVLSHGGARLLSQMAAESLLTSVTPPLTRYLRRSHADNFPRRTCAQMDYLAIVSSQEFTCEQRFCSSVARRPRVATIRSQAFINELFLAGTDAASREMLFFFLLNTVDTRILFYFFPSQ